VTLGSILRKSAGDNCCFEASQKKNTPSGLGKRAEADDAGVCRWEKWQAESLSLEEVLVFGKIRTKPARYRSLEKA